METLWGCVKIRRNRSLFCTKWPQLTAVKTIYCSFLFITLWFLYREAGLISARHTGTSGLFLTQNRRGCLTRSSFTAYFRALLHGPGGSANIGIYFHNRKKIASSVLLLGENIGRQIWIAGRRYDDDKHNRCLTRSPLTALYPRTRSPRRYFRLLPSIKNIHLIPNY